MENQEKVLGFLEIGLGTCCHKFSGLQREYLCSTVNVLTNCPKSSDLTRIKLFLFLLTQINVEVV